jgi:hypothetical protein
MKLGDNFDVPQTFRRLFNRSIAKRWRSHPENTHVLYQVLKIFTVKLNSFCAIEFSA